MFAIRTWYAGPTNTRGSRIYASGHEYRTHISYPYDLSGEAVHRAALAEWLKNAHEKGRVTGMTDAQRDSANWIAGWTEDGYVYVYAGGYDD